MSSEEMYREFHEGPKKPILTRLAETLSDEDWQELTKLLATPPTESAEIDGPD